MASRKSQGKAGVAASRRGQQMGDARSTNTPAKQERAKDATPAARGRRTEANKFFADDSSQQAGSNAARPRSNSPSTPGAVPVGARKGEPDGERAFKEAAAKKGRK